MIVFVMGDMLKVFVGKVIQKNFNSKEKTKNN